VRLALGILEGMRTGQSLGALLGYHFERQLHDSGSLSLRALVFGLRRKFPLVANQIKSTKDDTEAIEAIAASNVVDGLKLLRQVEKSNPKTYPWGLNDLPPTTEASHGPAIDAAAAYIANINDAVADLVLAEGVHQAVSGNFDRSAGTLDAFSKGSYPPEPEVIQTPRTGTALVLRTAIHLDPEPPVNAAPAITRTPMAIAEPSLNAWLTERMPLADATECSVTFTNRGTGLSQTEFINQQQLDLQAIDIIYQLEISNDKALRFIDDRVLEFVHRSFAPTLDQPIKIEYTVRRNNRVNFFETQALARPLRALATTRPMQPADLVRTNDSRAAEMPVSVINVARLEEVRNLLETTRLPQLGNVIATLSGAGAIDAAIDAFATEATKLSLYRLPRTGVGFVYEWRAGMYTQVLKKLNELRARWQLRLDDAKAQLNDYDANPGLPDEDKLKRLQTIEILVSTSYLDPPPATANDYRVEIGNKVTAYENKLTDLNTIAQTRFATLDALVQALKAEVLAQFDFDGLDLTDEDNSIAQFRKQLTDTATALRAEVQQRVDKANTTLALSPLPGEKVQEIAKLLLGDDFQMIPSFVLRTAAADDLANAWNYSESQELTRYLRDTIGRDFPVDDWLHGVARVREKLAQWETVVVLSEAFRGNAPELKPLQLPHEAGASWLALEIPPLPAGSAKTRAIDSDRLLYTAHFAKNFDKTKPICGLLFDEWTEVIPEETETTGITFHHDRPNSEPPQCWLLVQPAVMDGAWSWDELVGAVNQTLDAAKRRAIEPSHIATTIYSWLLPATYAAYTFPEISISNYLLRNVGIYANIASKKG
jgi:hypothetical protein